jgi:hypothetical protein
MELKRFVPLAFGVTLLLGGCGGGETSLTEYVEQLTAIMDRAVQQGEALVASPQGAVLVAEGAQLNEFTPQDLQVALERVGRIEVESREAAAAIEPPQDLTDLHNLFFDTRFASAREALAARAATATTWEELSATPEMAAYRNAVTVDKEACIDIQAELDATAQRGVFVDNAWIPGELKDVIDVVLGCATFPENPEDILRPPPNSAP